MSAIFISMFEQNFLFLVAKRLFDVGRVWMSSASGITSDRAASIYLRHRRVLCHWRRVRTCPVTIIGVPTATTEGTSQPITDAELSIYGNEDKYWLDCSNIAIKWEILNIYIEDRRVQWEESNMMQFRQSSQVSTGFRRETFIKIKYVQKSKLLPRKKTDDGKCIFIQDNKNQLLPYKSIRVSLSRLRPNLFMTGRGKFLKEKVI